MGASLEMNRDRDALVHEITEAVSERVEQNVRVAVQEELDVMTDIVAAGFVKGIRLLLKDKDNEDLMKAFWSTGYQQLTTQASTNASQWVGKRILVALVSAVFVYSLVWLSKNGGVK